ncbi:MAG: hypothetical protein CTY37_06085 [Methylotenera sp.]|nr:MAG: hypothetical protein CTY37_06085 [Methylotenera sp.]PPD16494.1 MAG: hypothetical protein CTY27_05255 [Methylotenera sp.]PPD52802.1 MAG: hypothetical protein CTY10_09065 [Methylotenera sp.]
MIQKIINYAVGILICASLTYFAIQHMGASAVVVVVLWGALLAKPILGLLLWLYHVCADAPLKPFQGQYYAFNQVQVRVIEQDNALWVVDEDILPIIGLKVSETARRNATVDQYCYINSEKLWVYSESYLQTLLQKNRHAESVKLRLWLQRTVYTPYQNKQKIRLK